MRVNVQSTSLSLAPSTRQSVARRIRLAFGRFGDRIRRVDVRLADTNGPRGGFDKYCGLHLMLNGAGDVLAEHVDKSLEEAVDVAAGRASRSVRRELDRKKHSWR